MLAGVPLLTAAAEAALELAKIARALVHRDHIASRVVNANHSAM
jgi:hypothetical protein